MDVINNLDFDNLSFNPKIWGNSAWFFIFSVALSYPKNKPSDEIKQDTYNFFTSLKTVIACKNPCGDNFKGYLIKYPLTDYILSSRKKLLAWLITIYNQVRINTGKDKITTKEFKKLFYNPFKEKFTPFESKKKYLYYKYLLILLSIILAVITGIYIKNKFFNS